MLRGKEKEQTVQIVFRKYTVCHWRAVYFCEFFKKIAVAF